MTRTLARVPIAALLGATTLLLVAVTVVHLAQGRAGVGITDLLHYVTGDASANVSAVVEGTRLPRLVAGLVSGAALGVAGLLLQAATRNRLVEPATMGIGAGAFLAVAIATVADISLDGAPRGAVACIGGVAAAALVLGASRRGSPTRVVLAGLAVSLTASAFTAGLLVIHEQQLSSLFLWGFGSLPQAGYSRVTPMLLLVGAGLAAAVVLGPRLDVLALGDETATSLGGRPERTRAGAVGAGVLLTAAAVAVTGPIGFVGLLAPLGARAFGPRSQRELVALVAVLGAGFLLLADIAAQLLRGDATATELPVGIVTALVGTPILILLARTTPTLGAPPPLGAGARRRPPYPLVLGTALVVLAAAMVGALLVGDVKLSVSEVLAALTGGGDAFAHEIVVNLRLPRVEVAALAGALLATCGVALQGVVRNPLADASLLGVTGGASVGALLLLLAIPGAAIGLVPLGAFVGALMAMGVVLVASWRGGLAPERLALVGIAVAAFSMAAADTIIVHDGMRVSQALVWLVGSTYGRSDDEVRVLALAAVVLLPLVWFTGRHVDLLGLGDDVPKTLGVRVSATRVLVILLACLLAAATAAVVGVVGFVGLLAPHIVRHAVGPVHRRILPVAALVGASLVVVADTAGRAILAPDEIPVGLLVALVGAPFVVHLLWSSGRAA